MGRTKRSTNKGTSYSDSFLNICGFPQGRVHFLLQTKLLMRSAGRASFTYHQINSNQKTSFIQPFADIVTFSECQATPHWGTRARSYTGIESVDVKAKVNWLRPVWVYSIQSHFHYFSYPVSIHFVHGERSNVVFSENRLLSPVYVPQANVYQA